MNLEELVRLSLDSIVQHTRNHRSKEHITSLKSPEILQKEVDIDISEEGETEEDILRCIKTYLQRAVQTASPFFLNQLYGGFNPPAFLGEVVASLTNTSMYTFEVAPVATLIEKAMIEKMNRYVGFHQGNGLFVTGGSNANLIAVLCARTKMFPQGKKQGIHGDSPVMFISDQAHYSFLKAANVLGIGTNNIFQVKTDAYGRMNVEALEQAIQKSIREERKPFFVAATAGTTVLGAFDPITEIANIAHKYDLWFHIDGAFGGSVLLSNTYSYLLRDSHKADSFCWDPHKMMSIPLICSAILVKDKNILAQSCSSPAEYLFHDHDHQEYDFGVMSLQCGRRVDALKLFLSWKYYGDKGYGERIDQLFFLAEYAEKAIQKSEFLECLFPRQFVTLCFQYRFSREFDRDKWNQILREEILRQGKVMINYSRIDNRTVIRLVFVNPEVTTSDIDYILAHIVEVGHSLTE